MKPSQPIKSAYWHPSVTEDRILAAVERRQSNPGFCLACGDDAYDVEPDARRSVCETCGARQVYSAEELLMRLAP
jgi:hypothetical protein